MWSCSAVSLFHPRISYGPPVRLFLPHELVSPLLATSHMLRAASSFLFPLSGRLSVMFARSALLVYFHGLYSRRICRTFPPAACYWPTVSRSTCNVWRFVSFQPCSTIRLILPPLRFWLQSISFQQSVPGRSSTSTRNVFLEPPYLSVQRLSATVPPQLGKSSNQSHSFGICLL